MITDALFADTDKDGINELILVGDWMPLTIFKWQGNRMVKTMEMKGSSGWWNAIHAADLDGDGDIDLIGGNLGLNSKIKGSEKYPVKMYVSDFDNNGQSECVLTYYKSDSVAYPLPLRSDMVIQMPSLKKKFLKYSDYASRQIHEIFDKEQLEKAVLREANWLQSAIFVNDGNGNFTLKPLPVEAQYSPVYDILAEDLNNDGIIDLYLVGNFSGVKPEIGKYDANYGQVFIGKGNNDFEYLPPVQSGLKVKGEARSITFIKNKNGKKYLMVTINNGNPYLFSSKP